MISRALLPPRRPSHQRRNCHRLNDRFKLIVRPLANLCMPLTLLLLLTVALLYIGTNHTLLSNLNGMFLPLLLPPTLHVVPQYTIGSPLGHVSGGVAPAHAGAGVTGLQGLIGIPSGNPFPRRLFPTWTSPLVLLLVHPTGNHWSAVSGLSCTLVSAVYCMCTPF